MASAFDLFGTLSIETGAFEKSLIEQDRKLTRLQGQLALTEKESLKLGDTSAVTAREFEKLNERIQAQRDKLAQAGAGYATGSVNATKFATATAQVDRATASLNSRLLDTKAHLKDIGDSKEPGNAFGARPLQGFGGVFRAAGLTGKGFDETEANVALNLIGKLGISVSALTIAGGVAAIGIGIIAVSSKIQAQAEARLVAEENIAIAINQQVIATKQNLADYEKFKQAISDKQAFTAKVQELVSTGDQTALRNLQAKTDADNKAKAAEIAKLQSDLNLRENILASDQSQKAGKFFGSDAGVLRQRVGEDKAVVERTKKALEDAQKGLEAGKNTFQQLGEAQKTATSIQDKAFADRFEAFKKDQESQKEIAQRAAEAAIEAEKQKQAEIKRTIEKLDELQKKQIEAVLGLAVTSTKDNPIAHAMSEAEKAVEKLKESLKGLPPALIASQVALQNAQSGADIFGAKLDAALSGINLRSQADKFRGPTQNEQFKRLQDRLANDGIVLTGNLNNFTVASPGGGNTDAINDFVQQQINGIAGSPAQRARELLDKQLNAAGGAKSEIEKARADRAITGLAGRLNPDDLRKDQREQIAQAFDRQADRTDRLAIEALQTAKETKDAVKKIQEFTDAQKEKAKSGIDLNIKLQDDTSDKKVTAAAATPSDVEKTYSLDFFGGSNR